MSGIQFAATAMDDLLFAGLDSALTNKDSEDIWADFGKKTAINAVTTSASFGVGAAVGAASTATAKAMIRVAGTYTTTVTTSYINAFDFKEGKMDWDAARESWTSTSTIAGALGAGASTWMGSHLSSSEILSNQKFERFSELGISKLAAQMTGELVKYTTYTVANWRSTEGSFGEALLGGLNDMGGLTLNLLNLSTIASMLGADKLLIDGVEIDVASNMNLGLLELNFTNFGTSDFSVSSRFGTNGIDLSGFIYDLGTNITKDDWYNLLRFSKSSLEAVNEKYGINNGEMGIRSSEYFSNLYDDLKDTAKKFINEEQIIHPDSLNIPTLNISLPEQPDLLMSGWSLSSNLLPEYTYKFSMRNSETELAVRMLGDGFNPIKEKGLNTVFSDMNNMITGGSISLNTMINNTLSLNINVEQSFSRTLPETKFKFNVNAKVTDRFELQSQYNFNTNGPTSGARIDMKTGFRYSTSF